MRARGRYGRVARIAGGGGKERHEHERVVERRTRVLLVVKVSACVTN